ncbi:hypothetical protein WA026_022762 [Henosepilachna vigintioctopunctata]|uniref:MADF domain-containing protein n=1 Tax=Henosepilachna vigintioctopunctata TaxID=420089 RepID=A0AAW1UPQ1_9CUCU
MDAAQLIVIVQEYEELYNLRNHQYSNQQRRDNIWEEIGRRMNHPNDNEYTLQYVRTLMITGVIKTDRIFCVQRVFKGDIETVYEEQQPTENVSTAESQETFHSDNSKEKTFWEKRKLLR